MKKYLRLLSCLLVVACLVSSVCIPTFAATGDFSDISPFAYPERQKKQSFTVNIRNPDEDILITCNIEIVGMWSQVEHSAYMTDATCTISGPERSIWRASIQINADTTFIRLYRNDEHAYLIGFKIFQNGNINGYMSEIALPIIIEVIDH